VACALASAFAGSALADEPNGPANRAASAGAVGENAGWRTSLFVTKPTVEKDADALALGSTVTARFSRPLTKHTRVSIDLFDTLQKPAGTPDDFAAVHTAPHANVADDFPRPADGRGIRLGLKITF
jgi:hypothetical protein